MKQAFGIFAALILVPSMQVQAWVGGPWSNDSYQENGDDGVYEAVGTMTDGTAMYRWAVQNNTAGGATILGAQADGSNTSNVQFGGMVGASSAHIIWYRGLVYYGQCFGIVNSSMKLVQVTGNASDTGLIGPSGSINAVRITTGATSGLTGLANGQGSATISTRKSVANSTWKAKINQSHPMKRFHGYGNVEFIGDPDFDLILTQTGGSSGVVGVGGTDVSVTAISSRSGDQHFPPIGHRVGMKIFGTQVSTRVTG